MGCSCSSGQDIGQASKVVVVEAHSPVILSPPSVQYLLQCNHCGAGLELAVPSDTGLGTRIVTTCAGCSRTLHIRLGVTPARPSYLPRSSSEVHPASNRNRGTGGLLGDVTGQKDSKDAMERASRDHLVKDLPREKYNPKVQKELSECEFCLQDYVAGDELIRLPCNHAFHSHCAEPWLRKAGTCPVCQRDVCKAVCCRK